MVLRTQSFSVLCCIIQVLVLMNDRTRSSVLFERNLISKRNLRRLRPFISRFLHLMCVASHLLIAALQMPPGISDECRDLIKNILQMTPRKRLTLEQIQSHDFLAGIPRPIPFNKYNICPQIEEERPASDPDQSQPADVETGSESDSVKTIVIPQSKEETEVRRQLHALGITDQMMSECQYIGAKSMVTGTYR